MEEIQELDGSSIYARFPLDRDTDQFRLLIITPGEWDEPIRCRLSAVQLGQVQDDHDYWTLSYVWGPPEPRQTISLEGETFSVGPNVFNAIRRLRSYLCQEGSGDDTRIEIWIDAICINQNSIPERNHQVAMMGQIYAGCGICFTWLGEIGGGDPRDCKSHWPGTSLEYPTRQPHAVGCQCLGAAWDMLSKDSTPMPRMEQVFTTLNRLNNVKTCDDLQSCRLFANQEEMATFQAFMQFLLKNPYFERTWVVQEIALAPRVFFFMSSSFIDFDILLEARSVLLEHMFRRCCRTRTYLFALDLSLGLPFGTLASIREARREGVEYLCNSEYFRMRGSYIGIKASLDHDLVYGLLGLTSLRRHINPRYDLPVVEVYTDVARQSLQVPASCDCWDLNTLALAPVRSRYPDLPSWAIDHTIYENRELCTISTVAFKEDVKHIPPGRDKTQKWDFHQNFLIMRGRFIDSVDLVGDPMDRVAHGLAVTDQSMIAVHAWRRDVLNRHSAKDPYIVPTGYKSLSGDWATAWLRMICGGLRRDADGSYPELTAEEMQIILADARFVPDNIMLLDFSPTFRGPWDVNEYERLKEQMARPVLYEQVLLVARNILEKSRLLISHADYLGFGNIFIQPADRIFLTFRCGRPLILRPVEGSLERTWEADLQTCQHLLSGRLHAWSGGGCRIS